MLYAFLLEVEQCVGLMFVWQLDAFACDLMIACMRGMVVV